MPHRRKAVQQPTEIPSLALPPVLLHDIPNAAPNHVNHDMGCPENSVRSLG